MKKRKIIKIIVGALVVVAVILAIWLNSEHSEIKLGEGDIPHSKNYIVKSGKLINPYTITFMWGDYTSARIEFDIDVKVGSIEKIILTRESDKKTINIDVKDGEKAKAVLGKVGNEERWDIKIVCSEDTEANFTYDVYAKEKWITAIKKYRSGAKHHL